MIFCLLFYQGKSKGKYLNPQQKRDSMNLKLIVTSQYNKNENLWGFIDNHPQKASSSRVCMEQNLEGWIENAREATKNAREATQKLWVTLQNRRDTLQNAWDSVQNASDSIQNAWDSLQNAWSSIKNAREYLYDSILFPSGRCSALSRANTFQQDFYFTKADEYHFF